MGSLSLNKKYITNITASSSSGLKDAYIFLGGSNNTISTFLNSAELTGNNSFSLADRIVIYDININGFVVYFLRGDGVTWRRTGSVSSENNTIIPNNSIIALISASTKTFTMQGTNLIQKYYQGNISIKKQNLGSGKIKSYKNLPSLPLSTPNLYVSGLSVIIPPEYTNYANPTFGNPLVRQSNTAWGSNGSYGGSLVSYQNVWYLSVGIEQFSEEDGWQNQTLQVAQHYGGTASIPLTGWVLTNSGGITIEGTVILSTTP